MKKLIIAAAFILLAGTVFSQTLQKGAHLGVNTMKVTLDPDVTMNQYLDFTINTVVPEIEKHFPGMKVFIMAGGGDLGENKIEYAYLFYFETAEVYNKYFDAEGNFNDEGLAAMEKLGPTFEEQDKLGTDPGKLAGWLIL